jgi:hypothetical protein
MTLTDEDLAAINAAIAALPEHHHDNPLLRRDAIFLVGKRAGLEQAAKACEDYPMRDPAEDGNGYWAAEECAAAIRALLK